MATNISVNLTQLSANLLIVVEYSVHVLNPDSVDRSVKQDPLAIKRRVPGVLAESVCQHTSTTNSNVYILVPAFIHRPLMQFITSFCHVLRPIYTILFWYSYDYRLPSDL